MNRLREIAAKRDRELHVETGDAAPPALPAAE